MAFTVLLLTLFLQSADHKPSPEQSYYSRECAESDRAYRVIADNLIRSPLDANKEAKRREREKQHRDSIAHWCDLVAQQMAAEAARFSAKQSLLMTVISFMVLALTALGAYLLWGTLQATRDTLTQAIETTRQAKLATAAANKSIEINQKIGIDQSRAYVNVISARIYEGGSDSITLHIKNSGSTPVKAFGSVSEVAVVPAHSPSWFVDFPDASTCDSYWTGLGVGEKTTIHINPKIGDLTAHCTGATCLKGAVVYTTIYDETFFTEFAYMLPPKWGFPYEDEVLKEQDGIDFKYAEMIRPSANIPLKAYSLVSPRQDQ